MTRALATALGVALTISVAAAQPTPAPAGAPMKTDEKAVTRLENDASLDAVSAADEREARMAFLRGNDDLNNGLFLQAVDDYTAALAHWDHPAIHYNLVLALINLDRPLEVYDHLIKATDYGPDPLDKDKYDHAKEYLQLVEGQLADVEVSCDQPGVKVFVDGKEVFVGPGTYAAKVRAGKHTFSADKRGYNAQSAAPVISPGETFRLELKLYTTEELTRYQRRWNRAWLPYGVIGAGALFGLAGGGFELSARSSFRDYDAAIRRCSDANANANGGCTAASSIQHMRDSGYTKLTTGLVMYGIAGSAIATGAVLAYLNRRHEYRINPEDLAEQQASVIPLVAPGIAGALVQGHF